MRRIAVSIALGAAVVVAGSSVGLAFECPARIKDANAAIAQAQAKAPNNPDIALAKRWVSEAEKTHQQAAATKSAALHYEAAAKAKAAKLLADRVGM